MATHGDRGGAAAGGNGASKGAPAPSLGGQTPHAAGAAGPAVAISSTTSHQYDGTARKRPATDPAGPSSVKRIVFADGGSSGAGAAAGHACAAAASNNGHGGGGAGAASDHDDRETDRIDTHVLKACDELRVIAISISCCSVYSQMIVFEARTHTYTRTHVDR